MKRPARCSAYDPQACVACGHWLGTRQVVLDGRLSWFCDRCPTPDEIHAAQLVIQGGWTAVEERSRAKRRDDGLELEVLRDDRRRVRNGCRGI